MVVSVFFFIIPTKPLYDPILYNTHIYGFMNHGSTWTRHLVDGPQPHPYELMLQYKLLLTRGSRGLGFEGLGFGV